MSKTPPEGSIQYSPELEGHIDLCIAGNDPLSERRIILCAIYVPVDCVAYILGSVATHDDQSRVS